MTDSQQKYGANANVILPYGEVTIVSQHPRLQFTALDQHAASGGKLKSIGAAPVEVNEVLSITGDDAGGALQLAERGETTVYFGNPQGREEAAGCFVLSVGAKGDGLAPDADTYVSVIYKIPLHEGDLQHYMTIVETEPNVKLIKYKSLLEESYVNWQYKLLNATYPIYHMHEVVGQSFIIEARMQSDANHGKLTITLREPGAGEQTYMREPYFIAAPLPDLAQSVRNSEGDDRADDEDAGESRRHSWDFGDPEDSLLLNIIVRHPDVALCRPKHFLEIGNIGDNPSENVDQNHSGSAYFTSTDDARSRGTLAYEITTRSDIQNNRRPGRRDRHYLVLSWDINPNAMQIQEDDGEGMQEEESAMVEMRGGDPRYRYSVVVLRSDNPRFPDHDYGQRHLFNKLSKLVLAVEAHDWVFNISDAIKLKLTPRIAPLNAHMNNLENDTLMGDTQSVITAYYPDGEFDGDLEPAVIDLVIEEVTMPSRDNLNELFECSVLFAPCTGYYWENYEALLAINHQLQSIAAWVPQQIYALVENSENSVVQLERCYKSSSVHRDVQGNLSFVMGKDTFDMFDCTIDASAIPFQLVYLIKYPVNGRLSRHREYLATTYAMDYMKATVVHEWIDSQGFEMDGSAVAHFLEDANVEPCTSAGDLVELDHPVLDNILLHTKQHRSFGRPNVATTVVSSQENELWPEIDIALRVIFIKKDRNLVFKNKRMLSVGWKKVDAKQYATGGLDSERDEWMFDKLPANEGDGRALRVSMEVGGTPNAGTLQTIELNVYAYPTACNIPNPLDYEPQDVLTAHCCLITSSGSELASQQPSSGSASTEGDGLRVPVLAAAAACVRKSDELFLDSNESSRPVFAEAYLHGYQRTYFALYLAQSVQTTGAELFVVTASTPTELLQFLGEALRRA
ncbi:hypothetical protein THASP1DRAFT_33540, partial [Thamnocephalis sphaerospora]